MLGYAENSYWLSDPETKKVINSRDVRFNEFNDQWVIDPTFTQTIETENTDNDNTSNEDNGDSLEFIDAEENLDVNQSDIDPVVPGKPAPPAWRLYCWCFEDYSYLSVSRQWHSWQLLRFDWKSWWNSMANSSLGRVRFSRREQDMESGQTE